MALNVLVVDDSRVMRQMILRSLRVCGVPIQDVYEASNGEEGLRLVTDNWVDLALVDINMPVMTGEEMLDRLRQNPLTSDLKVIVVSTESSEVRVERLRAKGASFLHKPFTPEELRDVVIRVTGVCLELPNEDFALPDGSPSF